MKKTKRSIGLLDIEEEIFCNFISPFYYRQKDVFNLIMTCKRFYVLITCQKDFFTFPNVIFRIKLENLVCFEESNDVCRNSNKNRSEYSIECVQYFYPQILECDSLTPLKLFTLFEHFPNVITVPMKLLFTCHSDIYRWKSFKELILNRREEKGSKTCTIMEVGLWRSQQENQPLELYELMPDFYGVRKGEIPFSNMDFISDLTVVFNTSLEFPDLSPLVNLTSLVIEYVPTIQYSNASRFTLETDLSKLADLETLVLKKVALKYDDSIWKLIKLKKLYLWDVFLQYEKDRELMQLDDFEKIEVLQKLENFGYFSSDCSSNLTLDFNEVLKRCYLAKHSYIDICNDRFIVNRFIGGLNSVFKLDKTLLQRSKFTSLTIKITNIDIPADLFNGLQDLKKLKLIGTNFYDVKGLVPNLLQRDGLMIKFREERLKKLPEVITELMDLKKKRGELVREEGNCTFDFISRFSNSLGRSVHSSRMSKIKKRITTCTNWGIRSINPDFDRTTPPRWNDKIKRKSRKNRISTGNFKKKAVVPEKPDKWMNEKMYSKKVAKYSLRRRKQSIDQMLKETRNAVFGNNEEYKHKPFEEEMKVLLCEKADKLKKVKKDQKRRTRKAGDDYMDDKRKISRNEEDNKRVPFPKHPKKFREKELNVREVGSFSLRRRKMRERAIDSDDESDMEKMMKKQELEEYSLLLDEERVLRNTDIKMVEQESFNFSSYPMKQLENDLLDNNFGDSGVERLRSIRNDDFQMKKINLDLIGENSIFTWNGNVVNEEMGMVETPITDFLVQDVNNLTKVSEDLFNFDKVEQKLNRVKKAMTTDKVFCGYCKTTFQEINDKSARHYKKVRINSCHGCRRAGKHCVYTEERDICPICKVHSDFHDMDFGIYGECIFCDSCDNWIHQTCSSLSKRQFQIASALEKFKCIVCKRVEKGESRQNVIDELWKNIYHK